MKVRIIVYCENNNIKDELKGMFIENFPDISSIFTKIITNKNDNNYL
jgi:hypothetical protein